MNEYYRILRNVTIKRFKELYKLTDDEAISMFYSNPIYVAKHMFVVSVAYIVVKSMFNTFEPRKIVEDNY